MSKQCVVGKRIIKNYLFLKKLAVTRSNKKRLDIINNAKPDQLLSLVEICVNILNPKFKLKDCQKRKLIPHANFIRKLSRCRSLKSTKNLVQKGGGALGLAAVLAPVLLEATRYLLK